MSINRKQLSTSRSRRRLGAGLVAGTLAAAGLPLAATSAFAGVNSVPVLPHSIISFPARDFVSAEGYAPNSAVTVNVLRSGFVVGTSHAVATSEGVVEVNHPAAAPDVTNCWEDVTPDIQAGDVVQVLTGTDTGDQTTTANVTVTQKARETLAGNIELKGTAVAQGGGQIPINLLESRIIKGTVNNFDNGSNKLAADSTGASDGVLAYDGPGATTWTATFSGLSQADKNNALAGESRILWLGASGTELTIFEVGANPGDVANGPALPCTAPASQGPSRPNMTQATDTNVNTDDVTSNVRPTFAGLAGNAGLVAATGVNLYVDGFSNGTAVVSGNQYAVTPVTALTNGAHSITVGATAPTGPETMSAALRVTIDTVRPTVTARAPAVNTTQASQLSNVTATLSEKVSGVSSASFTVKKGTVAVGGAASFNSTTRVASFNPTASLAPATRYTATLTAGIKDVAGNTLTATSWSFTTGPAPTVTRLTPAANAVAVSRVASPTATFSENVTNVTTTTFILRKTSTGVNVPATVTYNRTSHVATLNPSVTLTANTLYTAVLSVLIKDADGNRIPSTGWRFTTGR